jgi:PTH1 family peptidyl-tRNA hydrolase
MEPILVVGLGNPGGKYKNTRHNLGFKVIDTFLETYKLEEGRVLFDGTFTKFLFGKQDVILFKPQTFMNLSGQAVSQVVSYLHIPVENIIVIYDDMDLPPGALRLKPQGSNGGHKGMGNIIDELHTTLIKRIRIGIGKPTFDTIDYVLGVPKGDEAVLINNAINQAAKLIADIINTSFASCMNKENSKVSGNGI